MPIPVDMSGDLCTWCEERPAVIHSYDEHNGPFHLCAECAQDGVQS